MSKIFTGKADGLPYYENGDGTHRAVYKSAVFDGLELPGATPEVDILRTYKWSGTDWRPFDVSRQQIAGWRKDILTLIGGDK